MRNFVADSVQRMRPSGIRRYFEIAATMQDVITLGIGEPDFRTPPHIAAKGIDCLQGGDTRYTANAGTHALREAIADYIERLYGLRYDAKSQVLVTVGVSEAMFLALRAILNPGEEVLVVEPCFVANSAIVEMVGGVPVPVDTYVEDDFQVTRASLEAKITPRTKAILISYPSNPTGAVLTRENLEAVAALAEEYDLLVISDEIYERLVYDHTHINFATLPGMAERSIIMSGLSKSFAMTGWRVGYVTAAPELIAAMSKLHQYLIMSAPTMSQVAALEALQHGEDDVEIMRQQYDRRRRMLVDGFNSMGLHCFEPRGAFYTFPNITSTGLSASEFCEQLLREEQVAVIPGDAFGQSGSGFIRACYATSEEKIEIALERMARFVRRCEPALVY